MQQALLIRLRPAGPWRYGPADGALDRVDTLYRSDRLFSAVTLAMRQLGLMDAWLDATARATTSAVAFSSLFPFQGDTLYATPPATLWPPPAGLINSSSPVFLSKIPWRAARFVPLSIIDSLLTSQPILADQWLPDIESGCLLRRDRPSASPFRIVQRSTAAVDRLRLTAHEAPARACVEFEPGSGLWTIARFQDDAAHTNWNEPLQAAFKLLADTGFGGGRTKGWGQTSTPEFESGAWPGIFLPKLGRFQRTAPPDDEPAAHKLYWLLSLYSPAQADTIDWTGGEYELAVRTGRVESTSASASLKKSIRMVVEGCVLSAAAEPSGVAVDVAPEGISHPVYRSGIALSLPLPPPKLFATDIAVVPELMTEPRAQPVEPAPKAEPTLEPSPEPEHPGTHEPSSETPEHAIQSPDGEGGEVAESPVEPAPTPEPISEPAPQTSEPSLQNPDHEGGDTAAPPVEPEPESEPISEPTPEPEPPGIHDPSPESPEPPMQDPAPNEGDQAQTPKDPGYEI